MRTALPPSGTHKFVTWIKYIFLENIFKSKNLFFECRPNIDRISMHIFCTSVQVTSTSLHKSKITAWGGRHEGQRDYKRWWSSQQETSTGKHLGHTGKLRKTRNKETTEGRGSSGINFPSYYPHMCKTHTAAQSLGVECAWGFRFFCLLLGFGGVFFFLNRRSVGYTHENTVTASYKNKNETHLFLSYFFF